MGVSDGYAKMALTGLHVVLCEMAKGDPERMVRMSNRKLSVKFGIARNTIDKMINELEAQGLAKKKLIPGIDGNYYIQVRGGSMNEPGGSMNKPAGSMNEPVHERSQDHEKHVSLSRKKNREEGVDRHRRRRQFLEENTDLKGLWATYRHNPGTNPDRDLDESIELWPDVIEHVGMPAIIEHFEKLDEAAIRCDKSTRFVEQLNRLMSRIVL